MILHRLRILMVLTMSGLVSGGYSGYTWAHHSFAADFDVNKPIKISGTVTEVNWTNPHVWLYVDVEDGTTGKVTNWGAQMAPPQGLRRMGWTRDMLKIGERVTIEGFSARDSAQRMSARTVSLTSATDTRPDAPIHGGSSGTDSAN